MEHKFICFEMALHAMQAAQYIKAIEGYRVSSTIIPEEGSMELRIYSKEAGAICLPDGYLYSERENRSIGLVTDTEWFITTYYYYY